MNSVGPVMASSRWSIWLTGLARQRWIWLLFALLAVGIGAVAVGWNLPPAAPPPGESASLEPTRVFALGRLEPRGTVLRVSPPSGNEGARVESLLVEEGQLVEAGQVLAVMDTANRRRAALAQAQARCHAAEARLEQTKAGAKPAEIRAQATAVELAAEQVAVAEREFHRVEALRQRQVATVEEFDRRRWSLDRAVLEHRRAQELLESVSHVREIDVAVQQREVEAAQADRDSAAADLEAARVTAPAPGKVLKIHARPGERVGTDGLLELGQVDDMLAVAEVYEADVARVCIGQAAEVTIDSTQEVLYGQVEQIGLIVARKGVLSNDPVSDTDARVLEVRIKLGPEESRRVSSFSNARVEVAIEVQGRDASPDTESQPAAP